MQAFSGLSANEVWKAAAKELLTIDPGSSQSRGGATRELIHAVLEVSHPRHRWVIGRLPAMNPAFALAEVVWIIRGRDDLGFLKHWNPKYPQFVGGDETVYGAYGARLRSRNGPDQLRLAYDALKHLPESRQVVLQIWNADSDLPTANGAARSMDVPCNIVSCLKLRFGRLHWLQILRSNDIYLGMPHNFIQFTMLHEIVAGWLGCEVGTYTHVADSLHLYEKNIDNFAVDDVIVPETSSDQFAESYEESEVYFKQIESLMEAMVRSETMSAKSLLIQAEALPAAYKNIILITAADHFRRHRRVDESLECAAQCTNPAYQQLWQRWLDRCSR